MDRPAGRCALTFFWLVPARRFREFQRCKAF
jgi:hypothetical protein